MSKSFDSLKPTELGLVVVYETHRIRVGSGVENFEIKFMMIM
jgi:hypothetical protein